MGVQSTIELCLIIATITGTFFETANGISCYQCVSTDHTNPYQCNEYMEDVDLVPQPCDAVYEAQYCIKHTGRFEVSAFNCYQCTSTNSIECTDELIHNSGDAIYPTNCNHVFEARYCIKTTGLFGGGLGTKRFCSSLDLGNYCNYIQQPGDELEYRSCVFTCSSDGCNPANALKSPPVTTLAVLALIALVCASIRG